MESALEIQRIRLKILELLYLSVDGKIKKPIEIDFLKEKLENNDEERINSELFYLVEKGYLNYHASVKEFDQEYIRLVSLSSFGADLIQRANQKMDLGEYSKDFSSEAISVFNISNMEGNSTVIINSPNANVQNTFANDDLNKLSQFVSEVIEEARRQHRQDIIDFGTQIQTELRKAPIKTEYLKGLLTGFISISNSIAANLLTPNVQALLNTLIGITQ